MEQTATNTFKDFAHRAVTMLKHFFEQLTNWVIEISWMKFFLFAILVLIIGGITQGMFSSSEETVIINKKAPIVAGEKSLSFGVHIDDGNKKEAQSEDEEFPPAASPTESTKATNKKSPPGEGLDVTHIHKESKSSWLMSLIMISLFSLFGIKALMGGKRRAELLAKAAQQDAERESLKCQVAEAKVQLMQAQIEPHFLFNTLASVEHLIETDPPRAGAMQRSLIQYLRAVIPQVRENSGNTNLGQETEIVREYLALLKMRMEERLEYVISIPERLHCAAFPAMMLQTLVENAIKHGLEPKAEGGKITISAEVVQDKLQICVSDNGLGFGTSLSDGTGLGLQNIRERLTLLYQDNYQFIIAPNSPSGVSITIEIPYKTA